MFNKKAINAYERGLILKPDDFDLLIGRSLLYLNTPEKYGGNRSVGLNILRDLLNHPVYSNHAKVILSRFDVPEIAQEMEASCDVKVESTILDRARVLSISSLSLKLSDNFLLDIDDLVFRNSESVAIIGRNGSGKTMLLEILVGLRLPDSGLVEMDLGDRGNLPLQERKKLIGCCLQNVGVFGSLYVSEIVKMHKMVYGHSSEQVFDALGLEEIMRSQYKVLSRGQIQRVQLYLALAHKPKIVFLDEPTLGLDERFANSLRDLLNTWEMTLILISHNSADIELVDRLVLMEDGCVTDQGTLKHLKEKYSGKYKVKLDPIYADVFDRLKAVGDIHNCIEDKDGQLVMYGGDLFAETFHHLVKDQGIMTFSIEYSSTEDFLSNITKEKNDQNFF